MVCGRSRFAVVLLVMRRASARATVAIRFSINKGRGLRATDHRERAGRRAAQPAGPSTLSTQLSCSSFAPMKARTIKSPGAARRREALNNHHPRQKTWKSARSPTIQDMEKRSITTTQDIDMEKRSTTHHPRHEKAFNHPNTHPHHVASSIESILYSRRMRCFYQCEVCAKRK